MRSDHARHCSGSQRLDGACKSLQAPCLVLPRDGLQEPTPGRDMLTWPSRSFSPQGVQEGEPQWKGESVAAAPRLLSVLKLSSSLRASLLPRRTCTPCLRERHSPVLRSSRLQGEGPCQQTFCLRGAVQLSWTLGSPCPGVGRHGL